MDRHIINQHSDKKSVKKLKCLPKKHVLRLELLNLKILAMKGIIKMKFVIKKILIVKRRLAKNIGKPISYLKNEKQKESLKHKKRIETPGTKKKKKRHRKENASKLKSKKNSIYARIICPICRGYYSNNIPTPSIIHCNMVTFSRITQERFYQLQRGS